MTRVTLRVRYSSRTATGVPGQVLDLEDETAQDLISAGRATLATELPPVDDEGQEQEQGDGQEDKATPPRGSKSGGVRSVRSRGKSGPATDEHTLRFYDPDRTADLFDPSFGRR